VLAFENGLVTPHVLKSMILDLLWALRATTIEISAPSSTAHPVRTFKMIMHHCMALARA